MALYIHHVPGRLRLQTARLKGCPRAARQACESTITITGVTEVRVRPSTGSLVLRYDRAVIGAVPLWQALCERGLVAGPSPIMDGVPVIRGVLRQASFLPNEHPFFDRIAGIFLDKLLKRSAILLAGAFM